MNPLPILMDPIENPEEESHIYCPRVRCGRPVCEHRLCPYCFGSEAVIAEGNHTLFCDYEPNRDPVCFGFPGETLPR
jgi:hypothetical protein